LLDNRVIRAMAILFVGYGVVGASRNNGTGTVTDAVGVYGDILNINASGNITNAYNLRAATPYSNVGTIENLYGVYIDEQSPSGGGTINNKWAFYQEGANDKSYFAGNVGIGTISPDMLFHVGSSTPSSIASANYYNSAFVSGDLEVDGTIYGNISGTINPGFTENSVVFQGGSGLAEDNANFSWYDTLNLLAIGHRATITASTGNIDTFGNISAFWIFKYSNHSKMSSWYLFVYSSNEKLFAEHFLIILSSISVIFITCLTLYPWYNKTLFKISSKIYVLKFPICAYE